VLALACLEKVRCTSLFFYRMWFGSLGAAVSTVVLPLTQSSPEEDVLDATACRERYSTVATNVA
jgi:hypothetical protein